MTNALKAISKTDDELRVSNYLVLFGGRDLEGIASPRKNEDGSIGEFFTPDTKFDSAYTKTGLLYLDWEHGSAPNGEPQRDDLLGYVDWKTAKTDDTGIFVERVLDRHNQYMQFLETLIDAGIIGSSSEPVQDGVKKGEDGEIKSWPLFRDSLTVSPMEPRMKTDNILAAMKGIAELTELSTVSTTDAADIDEPDHAKSEAETPEGDGTSPVTALDAGDGSTDTKAAETLLIEIELLELEGQS